MTPPSASASTAHARSTGHARTPARRTPAPRGPRRVSGPSRKAGGAKAARAGTAGPRVSAGAVALPTPLIHRLGAVAESRSLDRLLRSRGWIALLGVLLIGLVFMQVSLLKLNAGMGTDVEKAAALERGNAMLQAEVSKLESNDRIQELANGVGMLLPTSDNVRYLGARGKRIGGSDAAGMPSQGEASTALLPTVPGATTTDGTTPTPTTSTTTEPQTASTLPTTAQAQQDAPAAQQATPAPATTDTTATPAAATTQTPSTAGTTTSTVTPPTSATTAAATGAVTVGGASPGG